MPENVAGASARASDTARLSGRTIGGAVVALIFGFTSGDIAAGVAVALLAGAVFSGVARGVSFPRMTQPAAV